MLWIVLENVLVLVCFDWVLGIVFSALDSSLFVFSILLVRVSVLLEKGTLNGLGGVLNLAQV